MRALLERWVSLLRRFGAASSVYRDARGSRYEETLLAGPVANLKSCTLEMALAGYRGCYNGCNPGVLSHNDILAMYRAEVDPAFTWRNFTLKEQSAVLAAGRSNNRLCSRKLEAAAAELGVPLPTLDAAVRGIMQRLAA